MQLMNDTLEKAIGVYSIGVKPILKYTSQGREEQLTSWRNRGIVMRRKRIKCHWGVFSANKMEDCKFLMIHHHRSSLTRPRAGGVIKLGTRIFKMKKKVLNSKFEHSCLRPEFILGKYCFLSLSEFLFQRSVDQLNMLHKLPSIYQLLKCVGQINTKLVYSYLVSAKRQTTCEGLERKSHP